MADDRVIVEVNGPRRILREYRNGNLARIRVEPARAVPSPRIQGPTSLPSPEQRP